MHKDEHEDCKREEDHLWEKLSDGTYYCVWCDTRVKRIGGTR